MNDKEPVEKICVDCGATIITNHGYVRKVPENHPWRCKACLSKYRSNKQKNSPTSIAVIHKKLLEDPSTSEWYRAILSENGKKVWRNATPEELEKRISIMKAATKRYYDSVPREVLIARGKRLSEHNKNESPEQKSLHSRRISESRKRYFENMTDEERAKYAERSKEAWNSKSQEEMNQVRNKSIQYWANLPEEERKERVSQLVRASSERWKNSSEEYRKAFGEKISNRMKNYSPEQKRAIVERSRERWINMTDEEKHNYLMKSVMKSRNRNNLHIKFEEAFKSAYISNEFYISPEVNTSNTSSHSWDYGIYSKETNELVMVVDLDGAYYHADSCDYDGLHSHEEYDEGRISSIPNGVKYFIIYEKKFSESFKLLVQKLQVNYEEFVNGILAMCRSMPFPAPTYTDAELLKSYNEILKLDTDLDLSLNTRIGDRLIQHFHPNIYRANRKKHISPYDAWHNDDLLRKCIENRTIYQNHLNPNKILQGFNVSKIAPKVSVFSAGRAKLLIHKYLNEFDTIFDPFSGFSGRMLGTISLGKRYVGQDISEIHVNESNRMIGFLHEYVDNMECTVTCADILQSSGTYPCLFTCPPYEDKEQWLDVPVSRRTCDDWIDICLKNFKCKRYLFVVDETERYKEYVVDEIRNKSHFGGNQEYIILIDK